MDYIGESSGWPSKGWPSAPFDMCMSEKPRGGYFRALWNEKPFLGLYVIDYNLDEDPGKDHWQAPGNGTRLDFSLSGCACHADSNAV